MPNTWFPSNGVSRRLFNAALAALLAFATLVIIPGSVPAAQGAEHEGNVPPGFPEACGLDFLVILDESGSIRDAGAIGDMTGAFDTLVTSLMSTDSRIYAMDFNSNANPWGNGWVDTIPANQGTFDTYIGGYSPPGSPEYWTNWEDAFRVAHHSGAVATADVVLFITDGNPTATVDRTSTAVDTVAEYSTFWPLNVPADVNTNVANSTAYNAANVDLHPDGGSAVAQLVKSSSYVWGIGVGDAFGSADARNRLADVSDVSTLVDFNDLGDVLRQAVFSGCQSSIKITKHTDANRDGTFDDGDVSGFTFNAALTSAGTVNPTNASDDTNVSGIAEIDWDVDPISATADLAITESPKTGWDFRSDLTTCTVKSLYDPTYLLAGNLALTSTGFTIDDLPGDAFVACDVYNEAAPRPDIDIDKTTNDSPVNEGGTAKFVITVTNNGNVPLTGVFVSDPLTPSCDFGSGDTTTIPGGTFDGTLGVNESFTYECTTEALFASFDNVATVTGIPPTGGNVTATDDEPVDVTPAPPEPGISLVKVGTFEDESGDGWAQAGETISYTFKVENTGDVTLYNVEVADLVGGITVSGGPIDLDPGESDSTTFTASYAITQSDIDSGHFYNNALTCGFEDDFDFQVNATQLEGDVCDEDDHEEPLPQNPSIDIVKDVDNDEITDGLTTLVTWSITVTNDGNVTLHDVAVTDALVPGCDLVIGNLAVGASSAHTCTSTLTPDGTTDWEFPNVAVAAGEGPLGTPVTANDDAVVTARFVGASATIGDTVWADENENGVQDNGEKGIAGATVRLTLPDATTVQVNTNANGLYLFSALEAGTYKVELILSSIPKPAEGDLKLTTAGSFTIALAEDESRLDADFGVTATLPKTGIAADQIAFFALALLLAGAVALLTTRKRKDTKGDGEIAA